MRIIKFIFNEIFYNGHFQTWGSLAIVIFTGQLLNIKITWDLLAIVYLFTYFSYLHDRYQSIEVDVLTNLIRSHHIKKIYRFIPTLIIVGLASLSLMLFYYSNIYATIFVIFIIILGFLYPLYFKKITKKLLIFKNFYISFAFSVLAILPNIYYQVPLTKITLLILSILFAFTFLRGLMMQFFLDLKDIEGDKKEGLKTLSVLWGRERVYRVINIMNLITSLSLPILYFTSPSLMLPKAILFLALLTIWNFYFFNLAQNGNFFGFVLGSGEFIYWPLFVYMGQLILTN